MVDAYGLLLFQTFRALEAADREVDFFGLCMVLVPKVIAQLKSGNVDQIEKAQVQIKADLPSPATILAVVYEIGSKY